MAAVSDAAVLAFYLAGGCARILEPLLCFLGGPSPRSPATDEAAAFLLLAFPLGYVAGVMVAHFAGVVLAYLNLQAPAPAQAPSARGSFADLWWFVAMLFTLVSAWLLVIAVFLGFYFFFLGAGKLGTGPGFSWNVLS